MDQGLWSGVGIHPDELEEQGYSERCKETWLAEMRADHFDPYADEQEELTPEELEAHAEADRVAREVMEATLEDVPF